jgi:hypothetical protein
MLNGCGVHDWRHDHQPSKHQPIQHYDQYLHLIRRTPGCGFGAERRYPPADCWMVMIIPPARSEH